ncbi:MAG TPA: hypothetical protein VM577_15390 [Anaerovoracaceae bacterium]|nr:hypothetical protein [Anaerovoracaceae bacterium]
MKVSIFSFAVNDKFPLDIMARQFKKYMQEEYELILFNDAYDAQMEKNINIVASYNNITCVRVPQNIHQVQNPSECYASTLNWAVREYAVKNNCEIVVLMHSDLFPICDVSISNILGDNIAASTMEFRIVNNKGINYFYPAFTIVNMKLLKNPQELDFGLDPGLDVGGRTKDFIAKYPNSVKFLANHQVSYFLATLGDDPAGKYYETDISICRKYGLSAGWIAEGFYHYMAGSQWNAGNPAFAQGHKERMDLFLRYFY